MLSERRQGNELWNCGSRGGRAICLYMTSHPFGDTSGDSVTVIVTAAYEEVIQ